MDTFATGVTIQQYDMPWWYDRIYGYIEVVQSLFQASGDTQFYATQAEDMLKEKPSGMYKLYKDYTDRLRADAQNPKRNKR